MAKARMNSAIAEGLDSADGGWIYICDSHATCVNTNRREVMDTAEFCGDCQTELENSR